jgi:zinc D-Ala-D-Ala carboxypeptidase
MITGFSRFFKKAELRCRCGCDEAKMDGKFLSKLDTLRSRYGKPIVLSSAYRCPKHNESQGGVIDSPHTQGIAVDILVNGKESHCLLQLIMEMNFSGVGVSQKGDHKARFIHVDDKTEGTRPWVWSY